MSFQYKKSHLKKNKKKRYILLLTEAHLFSKRKRQGFILGLITHKVKDRAPQTGFEPPLKRKPVTIRSNKAPARGIKGLFAHMLHKPFLRQLKVGGVSFESFCIQFSLQKSWKKAAGGEIIGETKTLDI